MFDALVVGAGIAGLTAAWRLQRAGRSVHILEAETVPGGNVRTTESSGFRMEAGPNSFLGSSEYLWKLIRELGMENEAEPAGASAANRYILRGGRLYPLPLGIRTFLQTPLLSVRAKARLAMEPLLPGGARDDDTAWDFFRRRFGEEAATYVMSPFVSGVYAGDVRQLGARSAFSLFWNFEKQKGSMIRGAFSYLRAKKKRLAREGVPRRKGLFSFPGGLGHFTASLAGRMSGRITAGAAAQSIRRGRDGRYLVSFAGGTLESRAVVLAVPPPAAAGLLSGCAPDAAPPMQRIPMAAVSVVHWTDGRTGTAPPGFGFLVPRVEGVHVLGTLFADQLFRGRAPEGRSLFTSFYGGMTDPEAFLWDHNTLARQVRSEHAAIFGDPLPGLHILQIRRYPTAIPQLLPDHFEQLERVSRCLAAVPGVVLAGNYLTGVGMEHAVESGYRAAGRAEAFLEGQAGEGR